MDAPDKPIGPFTPAAPTRAPEWFIDNNAPLGIRLEVRSDDAEFFTHPTLGRLTAKELHAWQVRMTLAQLAFAQLKQKPAWQSFTAWVLISGFALVAWIAMELVQANPDLVPVAYRPAAAGIVALLIPKLAQWWKEHRTEQADNLMAEKRLRALAFGPADGTDAPTGAPPAAP